MVSASRLCDACFQATDGAERAVDVIFKINDFLDTTTLGEAFSRSHDPNAKLSQAQAMLILPTATPSWNFNSALKPRVQS